MFKDNTQDPLVSCPFNKHHIFTRSRLQHHIIKCSRNYPVHFTCPYNALHRFLTKEELTCHIVACHDMTFTTPWKYSKPTQHGDIKETPFHDEKTRAFNLANENWDAEYQQ